MNKINDQNLIYVLQIQRKNVYQSFLESFRNTIGRSFILCSYYISQEVIGTLYALQ